MHRTEATMNQSDSSVEFRVVIRPARGRMIGNGGSVWKISGNNHSQEPVAQRYKQPENQLMLMKPQLQGRQGRWG